MSPKPEQMADIVRPYTTVADKIRALDAAGCPRAEIARFLGKRYQHVRNVLTEGAPASQRFVLGHADLSGVRESAPPAFTLDADTAIVRLSISEDGTIQLPPSVQKALGLRPGGVAVAEFKDDRLVILSVQEAVRRMQEMVRDLVPGTDRLSDSLIADRRREVAAEDAE